jgi:MFS family permease
VLVVRFDAVHRGKHLLCHRPEHHLADRGSSGNMTTGSYISSILLTKGKFQGLGAGGNNAMVSVIVTDMVALHERATYQGFISMGGSVASVSGSIIGAAIAGKSNWRM